MLKKIYKDLTDDQIKREIIFSSCLSTTRYEKTDDIIHELTGKEDDYNTQKERLLEDSFFNKSHWSYNIIRRIGGNRKWEQ